MYIKVNWKMRKWSIVEKTKKKNWIIAIIVAIFYLAVSILFDLWDYSWIIWIAYALYRFIVKQTIPVYIESNKFEVVEVHNDDEKNDCILWTRL